MKKLLLLFGLLSLTAVVYSQEHFQYEIDSFTNSMKKPVAELIKSNKNFTKYLNAIRNNRFVVVPYFEFQGLGMSKEKNDFELLHLSKDTTFFSYSIFYLNDTLIVCPNFSMQGNYIEPDVWERNNLSSQGDIFDMYNFAKKYSHSIVALRIKENYNPTGCLIVAYTEKNKLHLLGPTRGEGFDPDVIDKYEDIEDYIVAKYGSVPKYIELLREDSLVKVIYHLPVLDCKKFLRKSYFYYEDQYPNDTATILKMFWEEVDTILNLEKGQLDFLKNVVRQYLDRCPQAASYNTVVLMGRDIERLLDEGLTRDQKFQYEKQYFLKREMERNYFQAIVLRYESRLQQEDSKSDSDNSAQTFRKNTIALIFEN